MTRTQAVADANAITGKLNLSLAVVYLTLNFYQFFLLPAWLLPIDARWAWTLLPLAFLNNPLWSLLHEAIHDLFHPLARINALFGRMLSVMFGAPFCILRLSHLLHHKLNRTPMEATEIYQRGTVSMTSAAAGYYFQILGGLYLVEILSPVLFFLPRRLIDAFRGRFIKPQSVSGILMQNWSRDAALREIRLDGMVIVGWLALSFYLYGSHWPLLAMVLAARGLLISFLDNVYHYDTPLSEIFFAKNLWLPHPAAKLLLNFNLHGIHHGNPAVPWNALPLLFRRGGEVYHGNYFAAAARQLCGPVAVQDLPTSVSGLESRVSRL
jgi:fatty acid desaturase